MHCILYFTSDDQLSKGRGQGTHILFIWSEYLRPTTFSTQQKGIQIVSLVVWLKTIIERPSKPIAAHHRIRTAHKHQTILNRKVLTPTSRFARVQHPGGGSRLTPTVAIESASDRTAPGLVVQDFPTQPPSGPYKSRRPRPLLQHSSSSSSPI